MSKANQPDYELLAEQADALIGGESDALANTANFVALLYDNLDRVNWTGVYVLRGDELVLGPFQGKPACIRIPLGKGVCGTAAQKRESILVADVHAFEGHIACDPASRSELVVPLICNGKLLGVLDIDSPDTDRFSVADKAGIETMCARLIRQIERAGGAFI
ncbi:MAG: GAF domain-containing protein [Woeseiaceae bacterium]